MMTINVSRIGLESVMPFANTNPGMDIYKNGINIIPLDKGALLIGTNGYVLGAYEDRSATFSAGADGTGDERLKRGIRICFDQRDYKAAKAMQARQLGARRLLVKPDARRVVLSGAAYDGRATLAMSDSVSKRMNVQQPDGNYRPEDVNTVFDRVGIPAVMFFHEPRRLEKMIDVIRKTLIQSGEATERDPATTLNASYVAKFIEAAKALGGKADNPIHIYGSPVGGAASMVRLVSVDGIFNNFTGIVMAMRIVAPSPAAAVPNWIGHFAEVTEAPT